MEFLPPAPFESARNQDEKEAGIAEAPKKRKKKTTRVPLPIKPTEAKEETREPAPKKPAKKADKDFQGELFVSHNDTEAETETESKEETVAEDTPVEAKPVIWEAAEAENETEEQPEETAEAEADKKAGPLELPPAVPPPLIIEHLEPAKPWTPPAIKIERPAAKPEPAPESDTPEAAAPETEAMATPDYFESIPDEPPALERRRMIDPGLAYGAEAAAEHYRADPVEPLSKEANKAARKAEKRGLSRGVVSGALAGLWLGRRSKQKEIDQVAKNLETSQNQIKQLEKDQAVTAEELKSARQSQQQAAETTKEEKQAEKPLVLPEAKPFEQAVAETAGLESAPLVWTEAAQPKEPETIKTPEKPAPKQETKPEPAREEQEVKEKDFEQPEGRKVETSAWHRIEIDKKTGKAAEQPELEYGEEFKREQRAEKIRHQELAEPQLAVQVGSAALRADDKPAAKTKAEDKKPAGNPFDASKLKQRAQSSFVAKELVKHTTSPATWMAALVIVVLLFALGLL